MLNKELVQMCVGVKIFEEIGCMLRIYVLLSALRKVWPNELQETRIKSPL
uniref:Uncharacterized protein n=1 Tax=Arion vulgaris TaxID=1028688 RepID=A0A0B6ZK61_9EUPU